MKNYITAIVLLLFSAAAIAQGGKGRAKMEQVKALKIAFITNELSLASDEAAKFWPVYNAYEDKQKELRRQRLGSVADRIKSDDEMTEKEAAAVLAQMEGTEEELHQLRKKFVGNLKGILPAVKIIKLKKAEENFNRKLLKQYREKGQRK